MLLRAPPSASLFASSSSLSASRVRSPPSSLILSLRNCLPLRVSAAITPKEKLSSNIDFKPLVEVQRHLAKIPRSSSLSLARQDYAEACELAINQQINVEYNVSYVYHALFAYFDRDNVALPGFAKFFKESSDEERMHAEKLMRYQNMRGGKVRLQAMAMPYSEFDDEEKGDALCAMELTLALEKLVNEKLLHLHEVSEKEGDAQLTDFIEGEFLKPQIEDIKKVSEYVAQLRRVGKGHGVYHFDLFLQGKEAEIA